MLAEAKPVRAGDESIRVIDPRNAFVMNSMMNDVTRFGTAARAGATLKRADLAGKTGTTNDHLDAWFAGYQASVVGVAWIGFDQPKKLGGQETGGVAALPIWIGYMQKALKSMPEAMPQAPEGLVSQGGEWYFREFAPGENSIQSLGLSDGTPEGEKRVEEIRNQLF